MSKPLPKLKLGIQLLYNGGHTSAWRLPEAIPDVATNFALQKEMVLACERAKLHYMFWADNASVYNFTEDKEALSYNARVDKFEPLTLMGALSSVTSRIGFIATASTSYNAPYHIARKFSSLDHISGGRVGWNVVTSWRADEAHNFGSGGRAEHSMRYRRAEEFVDIVMGLWDNWDDGAFIRDKTSGHYFDPAKYRMLNYESELFSVKGPLNIERPVQGYPVIAQAGASEPGRALAARTADLIYTGPETPEEGAEYVRDMRDRADRNGRSPDSLLIMPGMFPVIGRTMSEAQEKNERLDEMLHPNVGRGIIERILGDISAYPDDGPVPPIPDETDGVKSFYDRFKEIARRPGMTIRKLYVELSKVEGVRRTVGTPESIADEMEHWLKMEACDGFTLVPSHYPNGLNDCLELLIPELQRRGLFRNEHEGTTLRESLGLDRPEPYARTYYVGPNGPRREALANKAG